MMLDIIENIKTCFYDRKKRSIIILVISVFALFWILAGTASKVLFPSKEDLNRGSRTVYVCRECGFKKEVRETRDSEFVCDKCSKRMAQYRKCTKCDFEFPEPLPVTPPTDRKLTQAELFAFVNENMKCPNCGSIRTTPITRIKKSKKAAKK